VVEVEGEVGLGEPGAVVDPPRLAEDLQPLGAVLDQHAGQVGPVDEQLGKGELLGGQVVADLDGAGGLGHVGGGDPHGTDQAGVKLAEHGRL
jgi:hypothetical protein